MSWRRLKVSNCRVKPAARSEAWTICCADFPGRFAEIGRHEQRGVSLDDGENVVEIMRDASGELADGFHLLRLPQLLLQLPLHRDVAKQTQHQQRPLMELDERVNDFQRHRVPIVQNVLALRSASWTLRPRKDSRCCSIIFSRSSDAA